MAINKELYPFDNKYFQIKNLKMHYIDEGKGEPIVMLHGNPTWSFFYRDMVKALSGSYRCIVPDHIGNGLSDKPSKQEYSYTLSERADNLSALLESLAITENITLVLHDWGGLIGMTYAHRNVEKIKRIVILNSAAFRLPKSRPFPWLIGLCKNNWLGPLLVQGLNAFSIGSNLLCVKHKMSKETAQMYLEPYNNWKNRYGVLAFILDVPLSPSHISYSDLVETESNLPKFAEIPKIICWADKDFVFDKHFLAEWVKVYPDAKLHKIKNSGHYILEDSHQEVNSIVLDFLNKNKLN